jgi:predicted dienelactone hydrolase
MIGRPADIKRLIGFMLAGSPAAQNIDPKRVGFFGFSAGAYTGLVLAGADPHWATVMCRFSAAPRACARILENEFLARRSAPEPRIKAAVLADPIAMWLAPNGFASVKIPIQLWQSENGGRGLPNIAVRAEGVAAIDRKLREKHEYHVVPNAGHFAFMLCGPSIKAIPEYCIDTAHSRPIRALRIRLRAFQAEPAGHHPIPRALVRGSSRWAHRF